MIRSEGTAILEIAGHGADHDFRAAAEAGVNYIV